MAFTMSPIGKKKCSYKPMQKKGLISPTPAMGGVEPNKFDVNELDPGAKAFNNKSDKADALAIESFYNQ